MFTVKGAYHDCIHVKGNTLLLLVSEVYGGVNGRSIRFLTRLAHKSRECSDVAYHDRAGHGVSFFHHHACALSRAAVMGHWEVMRLMIEDMNRRAGRLRGEALANMGVSDDWDGPSGGEGLRDMIAGARARAEPAAPAVPRACPAAPSVVASAPALASAGLMASVASPPSA